MARTKIPCACPQCGQVRFVVPWKLQRSATGGMCHACWAKQSGKNTIHVARAALFKHGSHETRIYGRWEGMIQRCTNPKATGYSNYGGRGITVCERWRDFRNFLADMGEPPPRMTLERIDNNGDYCPENCRWGTHKQQHNNKRVNHRITYNGETATMKQMAEKYGINYGALCNRIKRAGWTVDRALTQPVQHR